MSEDIDVHRRWDDAQREIETHVMAAVKGAMAPYVLLVDKHDRDIDDLNGAVFGDPKLKREGLIDTVQSIRDDLRILIDQRKTTQTLIKIGLFLLPIATALLVEASKRWLFGGA